MLLVLVTLLVDPLHSLSELSKETKISEHKTASQQLDDAIKAAEAAALKVDELKKLTRVEDLKNVLALISRHGFTQTDLKSAL